MSSAPTGQFTIAELKQCIAEVIEEKGVSTRGDLENLAAKFGSEIAEIREENKQLKEELSHLHLLMDSLESKSRKNNLLFGGITTSGSNYIATIEDFLENVLRMDYKPIIGRAFPVGKRDSAKKLIVVEFVRAEDVFQVLNKTRILKDTGFYVTRDLSKKARDRKSKLSAVKRTISQKYPRAKSSWKGNALLVDDYMYQWDDTRGLITKNGEDGFEQLKRKQNIEISRNPIQNFIQPSQE
ncbi:hypothetical protein GE061_001441 [Apolygus lucorum]|uniref:RRM domain-containing protein n=1 Tax=Apolygus lucorum TaxID=248454 RepID=A0A8S9YA77_APOLU|nr:hypothetical protein GE061_001441 [Apolygus lucorum]